MAEVAQERKAAKASGRPVDPEAEARRERGRELRAIAEQAHGANLDLGWGLMNGLATVDPADMAVAKFFVFAVLGADYDQSPYTQTGDRVAELAARGVRLVIEEFRTDVTKTRKDGSRGALRIDYGDPRKPEKPIAWLWKFIDGAKTAGELYGRALVVIAAEQYASRLVVPEQPAALADAVALAQGPRPQGAGQARRPAPARDAQAGREGRRQGPRRAREGDQRPHNDQPRRRRGRRAAGGGAGRGRRARRRARRRRAQDENLDDQVPDVDLEVGEVPM